MKRAAFALTALPLLLAGCDLAPHYNRPAAPVPPRWPEGGVYPAAVDQAPGMAWRTLITDDRLRTLVVRALADNRDLRATVASVASARAQYRVQRSALLPTVAASGNASINGGRGAADVNNYSATIGFSAFEVDLFGRQRNLSRAAFEQYLATDAGARAARITLVAETANAWATYAADSDLLAIARDTAATARRALDLNQELDRAGLVSKLDVRQAETVLAQANSDIESYTTQVAQDRNAIELLVGGPVADDLLPASLSEIDSRYAVAPAGIASSVLLQRPDVLEAEHQLKAANANIGAARAAFFPTISLTTALGAASTALSELFTGGAFGWSVAPSATLPIFGGSRGGNLAYAKAQRDYYLASYEGAIQSAFRDVADALARRGTIDRQRASQRELVVASERTLTLANAQYRAGIAGYLDTLTAQRSLYAARQSEVATILTDLTNRVALYSALGADNPAP